MQLFDELRERHAFIRIDGIEACYGSTTLDVIFRFYLDPDIFFTPRIQIPVDSYRPAITELMPLLEELALIELLSYWKCACPKKIVLPFKRFSSQEQAFWELLFREGLSEFYYVNAIPISATPLVSFEVNGHSSTVTPATIDRAGSLLLVSGGKDTACLLDLFSTPALKAGTIPFHLEADKAAERLCNVFDFPKPIFAKRTIDRKLIALNQAGYLNGHTPFSAYLAFLGVLTARLWKRQHVVVANEASANEASFIKDGLQINHQFSKSIQFERAFREYLSSRLPQEASYYSAHRTLSEEQICKWFSTLTKAHPHFRSCNKAAKIDAWCGECPKCAFVALMLGSFIGPASLDAIFGFNPFSKEQCVHNIKLLLEDKPLDCVGTYQECRAALKRLQNSFAGELPAAVLNMEVNESVELLSKVGEHYIPNNVTEALDAIVTRLSLTHSG